MPKVEDIFSKLNGATYFSTLDLRAGYHHIPLDKPSIPKTAFNSPFGKYEYIKVPFGLAQAPTYFQGLNLSMKKSKCNFFSKEIQYLGHILSTTGIRPLPSKTQAIQCMEPPTSPKQVRAFLGLVGYYRKFIKSFAKIAKPLTLLTR